jgi:hypothetical protein
MESEINFIARNLLPLMLAELDHLRAIEKAADVLYRTNYGTCDCGGYCSCVTKEQAEKQYLAVKRQ